ncbi:MAG: hypothetical protein ACRC2T_13495, partial [Thermoguttaceae bacterium]
YPETTSAYTVCLFIQRQLEAVGVPVRLSPFTENERIGEGDTVDFWFVPCQITEPAADIHAILGVNGFSGKASPYVELALDKLSAAESWPDMANELKKIHRLSYEETTVIPLWQWYDRSVERVQDVRR